ncbi:MAG: PDZ domain-containing protein [Planctomycetota bacterium]
MRTRLVLTLLAVLTTLASCSREVSGVLVDSVPRGATILSEDGKPMGLKTPAFIDLDLKKKEHKVMLSMSGYLDTPLSFRKDTAVDVISAQEAVASVVCAPCCCGLPLLNLLDPVDVVHRFVPSVSRVELTRTGGGVFVTSVPSEVEMIVDTASHGMLTAGSEIFIPLGEGLHDLEFRAHGFESMKVERLRVEAHDPVRLVVNLKPLTGALFLANHGANTLPLSMMRIKEAASGREVLKSEDPVGSVSTVLSPGNYLMELEGRTTTGKVLTHVETFTVTTGDAVMRQLSQLGSWRNVKAWMGVSLTTEGLLGLHSGGGRKTVSLRSSARVAFVSPNSPAWKAGIRKGDILLTVNGHLFDSEEISGEDDENNIRNDANLRLKRLMVSMMPGDPLLVQVMRDDEIVDLKIERLGSEYVNESEMEVIKE